MMFPDDTTVMKQCCRCNQFKPRSEFYPSGKFRDGLLGHCKGCAALERERYKERQRERDKQRSVEHRAEHLERHRAYYQAHKEKWSSKRNDPEWVAHRAEFAHENYVANRDDRILANKEWARNNPERVRLRRTAANQNRRARALKIDGRICVADIAALIVSQTDENGLHCAYCYEVMEKPTLDHIVPLKRGGTNWPINLCIACRKCNRGKGAKLLSEWKPDLYGR